MKNEVSKLFDEFNERPIAYHRVYTKITGSITAGLLLSQLVYWAKTMKYKEFYKTDKELKEELCMGKYELQTAKSRIKKLGIVEIKRKGVPAKSYYYIKKDVLIDLIVNNAKELKTTNIKEKSQLSEKQTTRSLESRQLEVWKADNLCAGNQTTITENTTENKTHTPSHEGVKLIDLLEPEANYGNEKYRHKDKTDVIDIFREAGNISISYRSKTIYKHIEEMFNSYGVEETKQLARMAGLVSSKPYAPSITTPTQLYYNAKKLVNYIRKEEGKKKSDQKISDKTMQDVIDCFGS